MLICHCTLPHTNPNACKTCPRHIEAMKSLLEDYPFIPFNPWPNNPIYPISQPQPWIIDVPDTKPSKQVIEEFDKDGKLIKRTTIE